MVEILRYLSSDIFNISTTNRILVDEGMKNVKDLCIDWRNRFKWQSKTYQIVKDWTVEFHDLFVTIGQNARIKRVLGKYSRNQTQVINLTSINCYFWLTFIFCHLIQKYSQHLRVHHQIPHLVTLLISVLHEHEELVSDFVDLYSPVFHPIRYYYCLYQL